MSEPIALRQRWLCPGCKQTGIVECTSHDDVAAVYDRIREAHRLKSPDCRNLARVGARTPSAPKVESAPDLERAE